MAATAPSPSGCGAVAWNASQLAPQPARTRPVQPEAPAPIESKAAPVPASEDVYASRVIERGDTLARLIKEVYGRVDSRLIRLVKQANPGINNENLIIEGGRIVFPTRKSN